MSVITIAKHDEAARSGLSALERVTVTLLGAMAVIWSVFQVVEIRAPFPPIGILYAVGSLAIAGAVLRNTRAWAPAVAAGWALLTMIPESIPAIGHLGDWSELYTHFGHYLVIMTFFPLAALLAAVGIAATVQNRAAMADAEAIASAPSWLRVATIGVLSFIVVANLITIVLYAFKIP